LRRDVYSGWACIWCGKSLLNVLGVSAGIARGRAGTYVLDTEVYACPDCAATQQTTPTDARANSA
jgi:hypothetical protein